MQPVVKGFFDDATNTITYVVHDPGTQKAAIIDPVLDYDEKSGRTSTASSDEVLEYVSANDLEIDWILETHVHADHLSGAQYLREKTAGRIAIGANVSKVQGIFRKVFNTPGVADDGSQFDHLFNDGDKFQIGDLEGVAMATPGHTPACMTYVIGDAAFVGDTLFMPDFGTARTDFPGGSAAALYMSVHRILSLPDETRLFMCHDYKAPGRDEYAWETTVREQREKNIHINESVSENEFIAMREGRDSELDMPKLILPSIQVNMRAGNMPEPEDNGTRYLKIPLDKL